MGPIAGVAIGLFFGTPGEGFKLGQEIAKGIDIAISTLGDAFDFLGIQVGPPTAMARFSMTPLHSKPAN